MVFNNDYTPFADICYNEPMHIVLTGEKQVGKTTLVSAVLERTALRYCGLRSISVFDGNHDRNVYLIPADKDNDTPAALAGVCSNRHITERHPEVFDDTGCRLLESDPDAQLIVIDEIGNMERDAAIYSDRILSLLGRKDIRVLAVVQNMDATPLAEAIRKNPDVKLIEVTRGNREELVEVVLKALEEE